MEPAVGQAGTSGRVRAGLTALVSILLLMWPALINGQPFFFSDTSSYVRAGEMAARMIGGPGLQTIWSPTDYGPPPAAAAPPAGSGPNAAPSTRGNDPASGYIMAGRSPYFGLVLWLGWVTSHFWLFVLFQAALAYVLIGLALRCFGFDRPAPKLGVVTALALLSPLAVYNGVLLADALSGFGVVAFLILLVPGVRLARWEVLLLALVLMASVVSHLTHLVMLGGMMAIVGLLIALRRLSVRESASALLVGGGALLLGIVSVIVTSAVVKAHYGRSPVLVPLITARFVADGPGRDFIRAGCDGQRFAVCRIPYRDWTSSTDFLWSTDPAEGAFLPADTPTRLAMSAEDKAFAAAVLKAYPLRTLRLAIWNSLLQVTDLRVEIINQGCYAKADCIGDQFPAPVQAAIAGTPGGRDGWPDRAMDLLIYVAAVASIAGLAILLPRLFASAPESAWLIALWLGLVVAAMAINGFLGGAISEPQSRYQSRMEWLLPLIALVALLVNMRARASKSEAQ
jgi:hypothetical protein